MKEKQEVMVLNVGGASLHSDNSFYLIMAVPPIGSQDPAALARYALPR